MKYYRREQQIEEKTDDYNTVGRRMIGQREGKRPRHSNSRLVRSTPLNTPKECYALKQQIKILVGQRKLQRTGATQQDGRPILHKKASFG